MVTMATAVLTTDQPKSLKNLCLHLCLEQPATFCKDDRQSGMQTLRPGVSLPAEICESLLKLCSEAGFPVDDKLVHIFKDAVRTRLRRVVLRESNVTDSAVDWVMQHEPMELDISNCEMLSKRTIDYINQHGRNLRALLIGGSIGIFQGVSVSSLDERLDDESIDSETVFGEDYIFDCPELRAFSVHNLTDQEPDCQYMVHDLIATILCPFDKLNHLDLSGCQIELEFMDCLDRLQHLVSLVLYDVPINDIHAVFQILSKLKKLRALDLSQSRDSPVNYLNPEENLHFLVMALPSLVVLDLSGTNLPGFIKPEPAQLHLDKGKTKPDRVKKKECAIPGLEGRQFEFLGLFGCPYEACQRENIPAKKVTGDANEDQVILSVHTYLDKCQLLIKALNHLFHVFRFSVSKQQMAALAGILAAMKRYPYDKHIQISGSASLFYIVKGEEKDNFKVETKQKIIRAILDGMKNHSDESTMMRNGCLTLCHFKIPQDVLFMYREMVQTLLKMVKPTDQEEFVQRIGIYLLNSLACQVDGREKQLVGDLGAIKVMLDIISHKLNCETCDEVMEIAWSTMWNVTDETAVNCERFIEGDGMNLFLQCLEKFPNKEELLRNMMGLMGNVAEVNYLRCRLMRTEYVRVFSDLLDSESDGIEVSYNATGVLAHLAADGADAWKISEPQRWHVLHRMVNAINKWDLTTRRNINYRSFEPILRLVPMRETPESQFWAVWALCNLTKVYPSKYCPLVEKENGLPLLQQVNEHPNRYPRIQELAAEVLAECRRFHDRPGQDSEGEMEVDSDREVEREEQQGE